MLTFAFRFLLLLAQYIPIDLEKSVTDGVPDGEYNAKKADVDQQVTEALESLFCKEHLDNFKTIKRFLVIGLASHHTHLDAIEKLIPANSKLRHTPLFTSNVIPDPSRSRAIEMGAEAAVVDSL